MAAVAFRAAVKAAAVLATAMEVHDTFSQAGERYLPKSRKKVPATPQKKSGTRRRRPKTTPKKNRTAKRRSQRKKTASAQRIVSRSRTAPANANSTMPRYARKRKLRFGGKRRRSKGGKRRYARASKRRRTGSRHSNVIRLYPKGRPLTKKIRLRHVQHVSFDPAKSRWQYFKFYPSNLTNQILQSSVNANASQTVFSPMWHDSKGGMFRKWLDLWGHQQATDSQAYTVADARYYGRYNGTNVAESDLDSDSQVRGFTIITDQPDMKKRPFGFDQWVGPIGTPGEYSAYSVIGAKITMEHVPTLMSTEGSVLYMGFTKQDHPEHTLDDLTKNCDSSEVGKFLNMNCVKAWKVFGSGNIGSKVTGYYSRKKLRRQLRKQGLMGEDTGQGTNGTQQAAPDINPAVNFCVAMPGQGDPGAQTFLLTVDYIVTLSDYTPSEQSLAV